MNKARPHLPNGNPNMCVAGKPPTWLEQLDQSAARSARLPAAGTSRTALKMPPSLPVPSFRDSLRSEKEKFAELQVSMSPSAFPKTPEGQRLLKMYLEVVRERPEKYTGYSTYAKLLSNGPTLSNYESAARFTPHTRTDNRARWALQSSAILYQLKFGNVAERAAKETDFSYEIHQQAFQFAGGKDTIGKGPWLILTKLGVPAIAEAQFGVRKMTEADRRAIYIGLVLTLPKRDSNLPPFPKDPHEQARVLGHLVIRSTIENLNPPGGEVPLPGLRSTIDTLSKHADRLGWIDRLEKSPWLDDLNRELTKGAGPPRSERMFKAPIWHPPLRYPEDSPQKPVVDPNDKLTPATMHPLH